MRFHRCDSDGMYKKEDFIEILTKWMSCSYMYFKINYVIWFCIDKRIICRAAMIPWMNELWGIINLNVDRWKENDNTKKNFELNKL